MKRIGYEFEKAAINLRNVKIVTRDCAICNYSLGIIINGGKAFFDSGCDCVDFKVLHPITWDNFADYYNHFTNQENKYEVDIIFGLK